MRNRFVCTLALLLLALGAAAPAAHAAGAINFEESPPSPDAIRTQYCNGAVANEGVEFLISGRIYVPSVSTSSPTHAFTNRYPGDEFGESAVVKIRFTTGQSAVSMTVGLDSDHASTVTATLRAWSDPTPGQGSLLATSQVSLGSTKTAVTKLLGVTRPSADVRSVDLEFRTATSSPVYEVLDDLAFSDVGGQCVTDVTSPTVTITTPASDGQTFHSTQVLLGLVAEDLQSGVASVRAETLDAGGIPLASFDVCGAGAAPRCIYDVEPSRVSALFTANLTEAVKRVRVTALDFAGRGAFADRTLQIVLPGPNANLWAQGIEVTQAIQEWVAESPVTRRIGLPYTLVYPDTATSVDAAPLVAGRTTVARVYAGVENTAGNVPLVGVKATLRCFQGFATPCPGPAQVVADKTAEVRPGDTLDAKRRDAAKSWNFVLPDAWTAAGSITLEARVNEPSGVVECPGCYDGANAVAVTGVDFVPSPDFQQSLVYMLRIDGVLQGVTTSPTQAQMDPFFRYLRRTYPVDDATVHTAVNASWTYNRVVPPEVEECWKLHSALVTAFKTNKQGRRSVQGFAAPWSCSGTGGGGAAYTNVVHDPSVVAEEIGHAFGLDHAGPPPGHGSVCPPVGGGNCAECNPSIGGNCDGDWPWPHGTIGGFGFDVLDPNLATVFAPDTLATSTHDFMSYGGPTRWISQRTWTRLVNAFNGSSLPYRTSSSSSAPGDLFLAGVSTPGGSTGAGEASAPAGAAPLQRYLLVRGANDPALGWILLPAYEDDLPVGTDDAVGEGAYRIELLSRGRVVGARSFDIPLLHSDPADPADLDSARPLAPSFAQLVPLPAGVDAVHLRENRTLVATRTRSANAPALQLFSPTAAGFLGQPDAPRVVWEAQDTDGDPLFYRVDYLRAPAAPGEEDWQPLALDREIVELPVDLETLPGSASARVRVSVSDGMNTTSILSEPFVVDGKPPVSEILSPEFVGVIVRGQRLVLVGTASDLEEGVLPPDALEWTSNLDGVLGMGRRPDASALSVGVHVVTLRARDASGADGFESRLVFVLPAPNTQPVANAGPDRAMALGGNIVLDGLGSSDLDGDPLSFEWTIVSAPPGSRAVLGDRSAPQPVFGGALATGNYVVELVVQDGKIASTPDTVVVHVGPPANDAAASPTLLAQGPAGGTLGGATSDGSSSQGTPGQPDVWFLFTPPADGLLRVSTCGSHDLGGIDTGPDTVVSVHSGSPGTVANEIAANDDWPSGDASACAGIDQGAPRDSALAVGVRGGAPLWIRMSRYDGSGGGEFRLSVELEPDSVSVSALPPSAVCAPGSRTAVTAIPGSILDLDDVPMVLATSCFVPATQSAQLQLLDPRTTPATLLRTIDVDPSPAFGFGSLLLRGDRGDLLACANGPGGEHGLWALNVSPFDPVPDGTATLLFEAPSLDETCEGLAYDLDAGLLYVSTLLPSGGGAIAAIARYDASGALLGFLPAPPGCSRLSGLAIGGGPLLAACPEARTLHLLDPATGSSLGDIPLAGTTAADLECDPLSFDAAGHEAVWWVDGAGERTVASVLAEGACGFAGGKAVRRSALRRGPLCADTNANGHLDDDGDGLCDNWETTGIDWDGDGQIDLRLYDVDKDGTIQAGEQADPRHKDLYVEIDWMAKHKPDAKALAQVIASYAAAPVPNPDGATGVRLHVLVDEEAALHDDTIEFPPCTQGSAPAAVSRFDDIKATRFGTAAERAGAGAAARLAAKRAVFRWNLFAHDLHGKVGMSGCSELPGNDFVVTLGGWNTVAGHGVGSTDQQAGTFMHELGHTLGLRHGGIQHVNCKPNYLSIMSYTRQIDNEWVFGRPLDYSRSALPTLLETNLSEPAGIAAGAGARTAFGPPPPRSNVDASGGLDWNRDGDKLDTGVSADVNSFGFAGCGPFAGQMLLGFDDWDALLYSFAGSPDAADGVHVTPTMETEVERDALLSVSPDSDGDRTKNLVDVCPFAVDPDQADRGGIGTGSLPDGIGDACQCGDVSGDGRVTLTDAVLITRSLLVPPTASLAKPELCDVGGSTGCTLADAVIVRRALLAPPTAAIAPRCAPALP